MSNESKCPSDASFSRTGHHSEPTVVAESVEPEDAPPEPTHIQSYGGGFQLRRGVQDTRLGGSETGHRCVDDDVAGVVARRLRSLWTSLHSDGVAQRRHVPHRRRTRQSTSSTLLLLPITNDNQHLPLPRFPLLVGASFTRDAY